MAAATNHGLGNGHDGHDGHDVNKVATGLLGARGDC